MSQAVHDDPAALRADARRNRDRILTAATELFVEQGIDVPLDAIARRADVGIATLYRRFSDRQALAGAVALDAFTTVQDLAQQAIAAEKGSDALRSFALDIADRRIGVLMASLFPVLEELSPDEQLAEVFAEMVAAVTALTARAQATGELRPDASADDVMLLLAMMTRPLQGVPGHYTEALTPRLLHLLLEGLHPAPHITPPPPAPVPPPAPEAG